jgi:LacI family transcriptional regulator
MATLSDVAARAGVSVSAASRVLSGAPDTRVSDDTRRRIQRTAQELGYRPNFAARALKSARTNVVGLIVPDVTNAIFAELMRGVEDEAQRHDYAVLLARAEGMPEGEESIPRLIGEGRVDGVLVQVGDHVPGPALQRLIDGGLPLVFINSVHPEGAGSVVLPDAAGMRVATEHVVSLGHSRIGFVGGHPSSGSADRREAGFRAAMTDAGFEVDDDLVLRIGYEPHDGAAGLELLARRSPRPTAVIVASLNAAHGVLLEARRRGLRVPEDLSIVAMHDAWTAENAWPPLTCVRMPLYELGRAAIAAMLARITNGEVTDAIVTDPEPVLVVRESTAPPAARDVRASD